MPTQEALAALRAPSQGSPTQNALTALRSQRERPTANREEEGGGWPLFALTGANAPTEGLATAPINANQQRAVRAAATETRNAMQALNQQGLGEEFQQFKEDREPGLMSTLSQPIFDAISISQYATAGAAQEYYRTGSTWEAFKQAAVEIENALPILENEMARRLSWTDVLREVGQGEGIRWLDPNDDYGRYTSAAAGFLLDILADPLTYVSGAGVLKAVKGSALGVETAAQLAKARTAFRATELGESAENTVRLLQRSIARRFVPDADLKRLQKDVAEGRRTLDELLPAGADEQGYYDKLRLARDQAEATYMNMSHDVTETARRLFANTTETEQRLIQQGLANPQWLKRQAEALVRAGEIPANRVDDIVAKAEAFKAEFDAMAKIEVSNDIIDPAWLRDNYFYGVTPTTKRSMRASDKLMAERGVAKRVEEDPIQQALGLGKDPSFTKPKSYASVEERIQAGLPTELNAGLAYVRRGFLHARAMANKHLVDAVIEDPSISRRVTEELSDDALAAFKEKGYDVFTTNFRGDKVQYLMPKEMVDALGQARKSFAQPDELARVVKAFDWFHNTWKGYAVLSPGFHMRNNFSNFFQNWLAGVGNPVGHTQGIFTTANIPAFMRRATSRAMGKEDARVANMARLNWAALQMQMGDGGLAKATDGFKAWVANMLGVKSLDEKTLADLKMPAIKVNGKDLSPAEVMQLAKDYGVLNRGWLGSDVTEDLEQQLLRTMEGRTVKQSRKAARRAEASRLRVEQFTEEGGKRLVFRDGTREVGQARLLGSNIVEIKGEMGQYGRQMIAESTKRGGRTVSTSTGVDESLLKDMGMEVFGSPGTKGRGTLYQWPQARLNDLEQGTMDLYRLDPGGDGLDRLQHALGPHSTMMKANRAMGRVVENQARLAHFMDRLIKGASPDEAALSVKKWLFDYNELAPFEKEVLKRVAPFYTWSRKNIPLMFHALMTDPGRMAKVPKAINAIESLTPEWEGLTTPDYFSEINAVRLPLLTNGKPTYINPNLPFSDLNRLNWQDTVSSLNPFIKGAVEYMTGYDLFRQRSIESFPGEPGALLGALGLSGNDEQALTTLLPPLGKAARMADKVRQGELPQQLLTEVAGIKLIGQDEKREARNRIFRDRSATRDFKRLQQRRAGGDQDRIVR